MALGVSAGELDGDDCRATAWASATAASSSISVRFAELGLPGDLERDMPVNIAELNLPGVDMLLGADYVDARHAWISYATGRLFLR